MASEYNVLIWSVTENKWVKTLLYFPTPLPDDDTLLPSIPDNDPPPSSPVESVNFEPTFGYQEFLPINSIFPTSETWYTDISKSKKIIEKDYIWSGAVPITIVYKLYATDGITITQTIQDEITYNRIFEQSVIRTIL